MSTARQCWVQGRVQGVFFRAATQHQARLLGLTGYAKNLADGRVEVWAEGSRDAVDALCAWLWQGPEAAQVDKVRCESVTAAGFDDFTTG